MRAKFIYEELNFTRDKQSSLENLGVGKVSLIKSWLDEMEVTNYIINNDLTIDVNNSVNLSNKNLAKFPDYIMFNKVEEWFSCDYNQLTSLDGCPSYVGGDFYCVGNIEEFTEDEVKQLCDVKGEIFT